MIRTNCSTEWYHVLCLRSFLSLYKWYMQLWNAVFSSIWSWMLRLLPHKNFNVAIQSRSVLCPVNLLTSVSHSVKEYGHAKNTWSLVSSLSPHNTHPFWIPHIRILSPVESLFLTANNTIKEKRGTTCVNQTPLLQKNLFLLTLIWSKVLAELKWGLKSSSECFQSTISLILMKLQSVKKNITEI